ncbi:MAG: hypothetical protein ACI9IP_002244 [Arcticibacterium sp.]|jgi:hypothetical protein
MNKNRLNNAKLFNMHSMRYLGLLLKRIVVRYRTGVRRVHQSLLRFQALHRVHCGSFYGLKAYGNKGYGGRKS